MEPDKIRQVIRDQQEQFHKTDGLIARDFSLKDYLKGDEIIVVTGIRRCGKSSLLKLIAKQINGSKIYINFDDVRLTDFETSNFADILRIAAEVSTGAEKIHYFLDEIQNVPLWERWVNNLFEQGIKVFLTGSNSSLLSSEISTFLTGRNKQIRLFPFSFKEYLRFKNITYQGGLTSSEQNKLFLHFKKYLTNGGFPLVIKNDDLELSSHYFDDMLNKDILNRYKIKQEKELKDLTLFLISNSCSTYSYSSLKEVTGIKSLSTIKNYIDYLKNAYLIYTISRFDFSIKKQKISSSKTYAGDNSFLKTIAFNFSENTGKKIENLVFLHLLRTGKEIYYYSNKNQCDFVLKDGLKITEAIQVCADISHPVTRKREIEGLASAMSKHKLKEGLIITLETESIIELGDKKITVVPAWKWLLK